MAHPHPLKTTVPSRLPIGDPPSEFDAVDAAKWRELIAPGVWGACISAEDRDLLICYIQAWRRNRHAEKTLAETTTLILGANGFPIENPWLRVAREAAGDMARLAREFSGRARRSS